MVMTTARQGKNNGAERQPELFQPQYCHTYESPHRSAYSVSFRTLEKICRFEAGESGRNYLHVRPASIHQQQNKALVKWHGFCGHKKRMLLRLS